MDALFVTVFGASLVGSLHCAGMCGPLVAVYAADAEGARRNRAHGLYHGGRLLTYAGLGALAGTLGSLIDVAGTLMGVATLAAGVAGATVAAWGALKLLSLFDGRFAKLGGATKLSRGVTRLLGRLRRHPPTVRAAVLGLSSALLPCGWLYAFIAVASGTASPLGGAAVMATFWLGTVPALAVVGEGVRRLAGPLAKRLPVVSALALIVVGLGTVWMRFGKTDAIDRWADMTAPALQGSPRDGAPPHRGAMTPEEHHCH